MCEVVGAATDVLGAAGVVRVGVTVFFGVVLVGVGFAVVRVGVAVVAIEAVVGAAEPDVAVDVEPDPHAVRATTAVIAAAARSRRERITRGSVTAVDGRPWQAGVVCLAFVRFDPAAPWPVLLVAIRDEFLQRPVAAPGTWWPEHPDAVGGRDLQAGGTWLAVDPARRRLTAVFTPGTPTPPGDPHRTRGELPLIALDAVDLRTVDVARYLPFTLLVADTDHARWWAWDGTDLVATPVEPGDHIGNIGGLDATDSPRQVRWSPAFRATAPDPFVPAGARWAGWTELLTTEVEPERSDSLLIHHATPAGDFGTKSASLVALGRAGVCYDTTDDPRDAASWRTVL